MKKIKALLLLPLLLTACSNDCFAGRLFCDTSGNGNALATNEVLALVLVLFAVIVLGAAVSKK